MDRYVLTPDINSFNHHGVLGMKWGIRRYQPYPKGQRVKGRKEVGAAKTGMSSSQRKEYHAQQKRTGAAYKILKKNTKTAIKAQKSIKESEKEYDKAVNKKVLPWNRKEKQANVERAARTFSDVVTSFNKKESDRLSAASDYKREYDKLVNMTNSLLAKTNGIKSSSLRSKEVKIGKDFTVKILSNAKKPLRTKRYEKKFDRERNRV